MAALPPARPSGRVVAVTCAILVIVAITTVLIATQIVGPAQGIGFLETWDGAPATPQPWSSPRWITMPTAGDGLVIHPDDTWSWEPIEAGHGSHCEAPFGNSDSALNNHLVPQSPQRSGTLVDFQQYELTGAPQAFYVCNNHMMTAMKSGYGATSFMPRYGLDWSSGRTQTIRFEVNPYSFQREWWELYIAPEEELTIDTNVLSRRAITFALQSDVPRIKQVDNYHPLLWPNGRYNTTNFAGYCSSTGDPACSDPRIRRPVTISFNAQGFTFTITTHTGALYTYQSSWVQPLNFTTGVVLFSHWTYNPTKDGIQGTPWSEFTYHWDALSFDGPATPLMSGYPLRGWIDTALDDGKGQNPSNAFTVNIGSTNLTNPVLWGNLIDGGLSASATWQTSPARSDQKVTQHWAQAQVNNGAWFDLPTVRDADSPFVTEDNSTNNQSTSHTFRAVIPGGVQQGTNTVRFRAQAPSSGFIVSYAEIQVDPNSDLPGAGGQPASTATPSPVGPTPTSTPVIPTPTISGAAQTITFNDAPSPNRVLNGQYPTGVIDWGTNGWYLSGPWQNFTTNSVGFNGTGLNQGTFVFVNSQRLVSLRAYNGGTASATTTFTCPGNPTVTQVLTAGQIVTIQTGWVAVCSSVTMTSSNGWDTNYDDLVIDLGAPPPPTATSLPTLTLAPVLPTATASVTLVPPPATSIPPPATRTNTPAPTFTAVPTPLPLTPTLTPVPCYPAIVRDHFLPPQVVWQDTQPVMCP